VSPELDWAELVTGPQPVVTEPAPFRASTSPSSPFGPDSFGTDSFGPGSSGTGSSGTGSSGTGSLGTDSFATGSFRTGSFGGGSFGGDRQDTRAGAPPSPPPPSSADPGDFGLPTRVRQASLSPQLRQTTRPDVPLSRESGLPSPEAARNTMAALQRGWELGRSAADGPSATDTGVPPAADND
jgi:hypothetical protein